MMSLAAIATLICGGQMGSGSPPPTWAHPVREIMQTHCVSCHHTNGPAPFSLATYEDVASRAAFVAEVTSQHIMPPWLPRPGEVELRDHRGLSPQELAILQAWAASGHLNGDDKATARVPETKVQEADLVLTMPKAWTVPAEGDVNWGRRERDKWTFVLPILNDAPLRVQSIVHRCSAPRAVHAVTYLADDTGAALWNDQRDDIVGSYMTGDVRDHSSGECGGTGVGSRVCRLPQGYHWLIPPHSDLVMEVHFRPTGRPHELRESVGLVFATDEESRPVRSLLSMVRRVDIPAGESQRVADEYVIPEDVEAIGALPRALGVCVSIRISADIPGEGEVVLLDVPDFDPHWRLPYMFESPRYLPAGTIVRTTWQIENTEDNPRNPFLPVERLSMARRTGAVSSLLYVAAEGPESDTRLQEWQADTMRMRTY
jgi:hypothetical protein